MNVRKPIMLVAILVLLALVIAGCGGKDKEASSEAANSGSVAQAAALESQPTGDATKGQQSFQSACIACHGPDAKGVPALGKSLHAADSEFVRSKSDAELVEFIKTGRQPDDPLNTTGIAMPPKGGNPALSDEDLYNIVAWIRTLE